MKRLCALGGAMIVCTFFAIGCGDEPKGSAEAKADVVAAVERTAAQGSAFFDASFSGDLNGSLKLSSDFEADRAAGAIAFGEGAPAPFNGMTGQLYVDGATTYVRFPAAANPNWIEMSPSPTGLDQYQLSVLFDLPDQTFQEVTVGQSHERGTTYNGVWDARPLVDLESLSEEQQQGFDTPLPISVVVGPDGLVHRIRLVDERGGGLVMVFEMSHLGQPVHIGRPPNEVSPVQ